METLYRENVKIVSQLVDVATARSGLYSVTAIVLILGAIGILVFAFMDNPVKKTL